MTDKRDLIWDVLDKLAAEDAGNYGALASMNPFAFRRMVDALAAALPQPEDAGLVEALRRDNDRLRAAITNQNDEIDRLRQLASQQPSEPAPQQEAPAPPPAPAPEPAVAEAAPVAEPEPAPAPEPAPEPEPTIGANALSADEKALVRSTLAAASKTQGEMCRELGVPTSHVSGLMTGTRRSAPLRLRVLNYIEHLRAQAEPTPEQVEDAKASTHAERMVKAAKSVADAGRPHVEAFLAERSVPDPQGFATGPDLRAAYDSWRRQAGAPQLTERVFGAAMSAIHREHGLLKKQASTFIGGMKPILYHGIRLHDGTEAPPAEPEPETPAQRRAREAAELRELARKAQAHNRAAAEAAAVVAEEEAERLTEAEREAERSSNNGWHKPAATGGAVSELTVADLERENAERAVTRAAGYAGPRPQAGDKVDQESRELINAVLDLNLGWEFTPAQGGNSKCYLRAPDGSRFRFASTMGGSVGRVGNNRELRRYLNRHGMLPTAAAPVSQLTAPTKRQQPVPPEDLRPYDEGVVEADPGADPLPPEAADAGTFDLFEDVKGGLPGGYPFTYHPDVLALHGLNKDEVETAVRNPERVEIRPESKGKGYPVLGFQRGDVRVIMGFRNRVKPAVIACYWTTLLAHDTYRVDRHGGGGRRTSAGLPSRPDVAIKRLRQLGAEIAEGDKTATVTYRGQELGQISLGNTPKDTVHSDYQRMQRKMHAIDRREGALVSA